MLGTIVNAGAIVLGCAVGLLLRRGIPERVTDAVMKGIGLCVIYIGVSGALEGEKTIAMIIAMAAGGAIGTTLDLNGGIYQGAITLLAGLLAPVLTDAVVAEMTCVGSMLIFALGLNMIGVTKIKVMDFVPAMFLVIPLCYVL